MSFMTKLMNFEGPIFNGKPQHQFLGVLSSSSTATTFTFANVWLGRPDRRRTIVLITLATGSAIFLSSGSVNDVTTFVSQTTIGGGAGLNFTSWYVPFGTTANISLTMSASSAGLTVFVFAIYLNDNTAATKLDSATNTASTTTNITLTDVQVAVGGVMIILIAAVALGITNTFSWNGPSNTIQKLAEANTAVGTFSYSLAWMNPTQEDTTTSDVDGAESATSTRVGAAVSWRL